VSGGAAFGMVTGLAVSWIVSVAPPIPPRRTPASRAAAFFDLDKTIIAGSSALAFSRPFLRHGLISRRAALRSGYAQLLLLLSGADAATMDQLRRQITALSAGWEVAQVRSIVAEALDEIVQPMVYAEAADLIAEHRAGGDEVVVLSASGEEVVEPIAAMVGADSAVATRMAVVDGRYSGAVEYYCYGEEKAEAARRIAEDRGYRLADCRAYSDSITDLPLLAAVGHPTVVNPDRALRREALRRGWPVLTFAHPVPVGSRLGAPARRTAVVALGAVGLFAAGWYGHRRLGRDAG
jgi:HAD superfamily hydrolase (TIGR01490 family)